MNDAEAHSGLIDDARCFQLLVNAITDYAIYMLDPTGRVSSWNSGAQRLNGYTSSEILGQHFSKFYTEEERVTGEPARALDTAVRAGRYEHEGWRVWKDGSQFWASVVIEPIYDDTHVMVGFAKITRDLTDRRAAQTALEEARTTLHQSQKMEALGQLTGGIAHDFNNLLTVVAGNLDLLKRADEDRRPKLIGNAVHAVDQACKLTQKLLAFGRRETLFPEIVDLNEMIVRMNDMLSQSLRGDIRVELYLADQLWPVEIDPSLLQLAVINLAVNARDAMPKGGILRVQTENTVLRDGGSGEVVALSVTDTGVGMPREVLSRACEPFFTTKEVGQGTGLGLAQVYGFAQQSGGSVDIRSAVGHGTTVTLYLPRAKAPAPELERSTDVPQVEGGPLRILLVEDNPQVADIAASLLNERGHTTIRVSNAHDALGLLSSGLTFDLVLTDLVMPGERDGIDLAHSVRERWPTLPVLLATGYSKAASRATGEGFTLLTKPYEPDALMVAIQQATTAGDASASS